MLSKAMTADEYRRHRISLAWSRGTGSHSRRSARSTKSPSHGKGRWTLEYGGEPGRARLVTLGRDEGAVSPARLRDLIGDSVALAHRRRF
jgi:hypothetical protein